jgi:GxxExxY protein
LTGQIIGAAIEVHKRLGPGCVEAFYENALALESRARNFAKTTLDVRRFIASEWPHR